MIQSKKIEIQKYDIFKYIILLNVLIVCIFGFTKIVLAHPKFMTLPLLEDAVVANGWHYSYFSSHSRVKHSAIDYYVSTGTSVVAVADGYAMRSSQYDQNTGYGDFVIIRHDVQNDDKNYYFSLYAHLSQISQKIPNKSAFSATNDVDVINEGWVRVKQGDIIGKSGKSDTSWPHLHLQIFLEGYGNRYTKAIDPYDLYKNPSGEDASIFYPPFLSKTIDGQTKFSGSKFLGSGANRLWETDPPTPPVLIKTLDKPAGKVQINGINFGSGQGQIQIKHNSMKKFETIQNIEKWNDNEIILNIFQKDFQYASFSQPVWLVIFDSSGNQLLKLTFPFRDIHPDKWFSNPVLQLWKNDMINGQSNTGLFLPEKHINFAEFLAILVRCDPEISQKACVENDRPFPLSDNNSLFPLFSDSGPWYCSYYKSTKIQTWIEELQQISSSRGWPDQQVNRKEVAFFLAKSLSIPWVSNLDNIGFTDVDPSDPFVPYIVKCKETKILDGYADGSFKGNSNINRAEIAKMLYRTYFINHN